MAVICKAPVWHRNYTIWCVYSSSLCRGNERASSAPRKWSKLYYVEHILCVCACVSVMISFNFLLFVLVLSNMDSGVCTAQIKCECNPVQNTVIIRIVCGLESVYVCQSECEMG